MAPRPFRRTRPGDLKSVDGRELAASDLARACLEKVDAAGAVVVRGFRSREHANAVDETERLIEIFAAHGLGVIETHFGRIEDLRTDNTTNTNTDQLGYTSSAIDLHTDQPFLERPPRYQLLQSIRPAATGGANHVADARQAARHLRSIDAEAYALLRNEPVRFHRRQRAFESLVVSPVLERDESSDDSSDDGAFRVRYSYFSMAPHRASFESMRSFYRAYARLAGIVNDPRNQIRFALGEGDFVFYDNWRMLHARTAFEGARWVRGVYFDRGTR